MEVDEDLSAGLLEQLNSLQAADHDDLVSQMLRLVGGSESSLSVANAKFYLEMNGWNVQAAVCSYFDLEAGPEARAAPPQMTFVKDVTIGEGENVPPDTEFVKTWKLQNTGGERWPEGCVLVHCQGRLLTCPSSPGERPPERVPVGPDGALLSFQMRDFSVRMRSPAEPGIYQSKWRMSTPGGTFFGDAIWCIVTVERAGTLALTQQMDSFSVDMSDGGGVAAGSTGVATAQSNSSNPFSPKKPVGGGGDQDMN